MFANDFSTKDLTNFSVSDLSGLSFLDKFDVATNKTTPAEVIDAMSEGCTDNDIKIAIAYSKHVSRSFLEKLIDEGIEYVVCGIARSKMLSADLLDKMARKNEGNFRVMNIICKNENTSFSTLAFICNSFSDQKQDCIKMSIKEAFPEIDLDMLNEFNRINDIFKGDL